ncbi:hypothetical protein QC761_409760 [Podospora bellae-mahoneyi]|uniref:Cellobiose dehydrogenase-like cytochrome domain-containing protein n=1 Tax=Podospora bellae-mahoneyi TaxID=2093777 RepID=A0ABR0FGN2_9PEZI|nr:hypothetical protein QC761_409760 [Podospora bellae-mahoneyi]
MLFSEVAARAAAFLGLTAPVPRQFAFEPDSVAYEDPDTGLKFSSYTSARGISWRVAIPEDIPEGDKIFDTVLQVEAPIDVGWAGFAWGGHMTYNPLTIVWPNGNDVVLSSRIAYGYYSPPEYPNAEYKIVKTGTHVNATHFQITAVCTGCSRWGDEDIGFTELDPEYDSTLAFAYGDYPVDTPEDPSSTFGIHDSLGHPVFSLGTQAKNADFTSKIEQL